MSTNSSQDNNENSSKIETDEENLKLVYSVSHDIRNGAVKAIEDNRDQVWKILNFLILVAGVYVTLSIFLCNLQSNKSLPIFWPGFLSAVFLLIALTLSVVEIFPAPNLPIITPKKFYQFLAEKHDMTMEHLIRTYLLQTNEVLIDQMNRVFKRKIIILFTSISLFNFVFFVVGCIYGSHEIYFDILPIVFSVILLTIYANFILKENKSINKKKKEYYIEKQYEGNT